MTHHEITPNQLRALLLLLVLVPFIPMVLMLRFMADALEGERDAATERAGSTYHQTLVNAAGSLEKHLAALERKPEPEDVRRFYRGIFPAEIEIVVADGAGRALPGQPAPRGKLVGQTALHNLGVAWQPQLYLIDDSGVKEAVRDQFRIYAWTGVITAVAICGIAGAAGLTLSAQFTLHELKNTSVATVAHEMRTPLASMRMLVDTLREGRCPTGQEQEYLGLIATENLRLSRLTDQFLTHSRLERNQHAFHFERTDPCAAIESAISLLRPKIEAPGCAFTLDLPERLPEINADRDGLITILTNLLENALKYSGEEKRIRLHATATKADFIVSVSDNGVGVSRANRKRVFEPYFQVDQKLSRAREGCGLGLSIVKSIVAAHHGRITIASEPGQGSTFTVTLPRLPDAGGPAAHS